MYVYAPCINVREENQPSVAFEGHWALLFTLFLGVPAALTPPKTDMSPKKRPFQEKNSLPTSSNHQFSGDMLDSLHFSTLLDHAYWALGPKWNAHSSSSCVGGGFGWMHLFVRWFPQSQASQFEKASWWSRWYLLDSLNLHCFFHLVRGDHPIEFCTLPSTPLVRICFPKKLVIYSWAAETAFL